MTIDDLDDQGWLGMTKDDYEWLRMTRDDEELLQVNNMTRDRWDE